MALIAVLRDGTNDAKIIAVSRYAINPDHHSCEFALTVTDTWQRHGIGYELMRRLMAVARDRGLDVMTGEVLSNNRKMLKLCEDLGFRIARSPDDPEVVEVRRHL